MGVLIPYKQTGRVLIAKIKSDLRVEEKLNPSQPV